jgi:hypothetical protein
VVPVVRPSREVERHATDRRHVEALDRARAFEALTASAHERGFWYPCWSFPALTAAVVPGVSTGRRLNLDGRGSTACRIAGDGTPPQCGTDADVRRWELAVVDRLDEEIEW